MFDIALLDSHFASDTNREWRRGLVGSGLLHRDKAPLPMAAQRVLRCACIGGRVRAVLQVWLYQHLRGEHVIFENKISRTNKMCSDTQPP